MTTGKTDDAELARQRRLIEALQAKATALSSANICLSGGTMEERDQAFRNSQEISAIQARLLLAMPLRNVPETEVADLLKHALHLTKTAHDCADKPAVILECQGIIPIIPASSL